MSERSESIKKILVRAIELPAERRAAWVAEACRGDDGLRSEVETRLTLIERDPASLLTGGLEALAFQDDRTLKDDERTFGPAPSADLDGQPPTLAGYRILDRLGQGGMGVVYLAEQQSPRRRVALKVIRGGQLVDETSVKMFRREAQSLGRLKHPGIAAIYESGCTTDGQHFFAMELVEGTTLNHYLAARRADRNDPAEIRFRLRLFLKIADAVHYAHQRGVIHRDLKASNIIVTEETSGASSPSRGGGAEVKILDFGLARITDTDVQATTMSEVGAIKGTLPYMSPEQARGVPEEIDVRTDVYSLGVVLYEMLTGTLPYETGGVSLLQAIRTICEEPPRSMRSSFSGRRTLDPDVETICLRALEKESDRRYSTAAALADDVARYLASEPIVARPPSTAYQLRKFAARNRVLVGGVAATLLALVVGLIVSIGQYARAESQRRVAEQALDASDTVTEFLAETLGSMDPQSFGAAIGSALRRRGDTDRVALASITGVNLTAVAQKLLDEQILRPAANRAEAELGEKPLIAARIDHTLGVTYTRLGLLPSAADHARRAVDVREAELGPEDPLTLDSKDALATVCRRDGSWDEAERLYRDVLEVRARTLGDEHPRTLIGRSFLGDTLRYMGRHEEAESLLRDTHETMRRVLGDGHPDTLTAANHLGLALDGQGRYAEAVELFGTAFDGLRQAIGPEHPDTLMFGQNLGAALIALRRLDEAVDTLQGVVDTSRRVNGPGHWRTLTAMNRLGDALRMLGRHDEAVPLLEEALASIGSALGDEHEETLHVMNNLALGLQAQGHREKAEALFRETLARMHRALGEEHVETLNTSQNLGMLLLAQQRFDDAEPIFRRITEAEPQGRARRHQAVAWYNLACLEALTDRPLDALQSLRRAIDGEFLSMRGDTPWMALDPDLASLRGHPEFEAMVAEVRGRAGI